MGRLLVTTLLLAHHVVNAFEIPGNFANRAAAATTDPGVTACSIAFAVISSCQSASPGLSTAAESDAAACYCCHSTVGLNKYYSGCADYISASFPQNSTQYSAFVTLANDCASEMATCGAGGRGGGGAATATRTDTDPKVTATTADSATRTDGGVSSATDVPDACTSLEDILSSCVSATPSITGAPDGVVASCFCYTTADGTSAFNTEIDNLASSCAPWAKSAATPSAYSAIVSFEGFCESYSPGATRTRTPSAAGTDKETGTSPSATRTDKETDTYPSATRTGPSGGGVGGSGSTTTPRTLGTTSPTSTEPARPPGNGAAPAGAGGLVLWTAEFFSLLFSFFLLI